MGFTGLYKSFGSIAAYIRTWTVPHTQEKGEVLAYSSGLLPNCMVYSIHDCFFRRTYLGSGSSIFGADVKHHKPAAARHFVFQQPAENELGHAEGDAALILVADLLCRSFSEYGVVTRYAGDEFVVMMNTTTSVHLQADRERKAEL